MANNQAFRVKNGLIAQRYLQSAGTETAGSEGYNLADASYDSVSFSVATQEAAPMDIFFTPDGDKMYITGTGGDDVNEYDLSTAWDISTASFNQLFSVAAQESAPNGIAFKSDGTKMYITGSAGDDINQYTLSTAWDISTASYESVFSVSSQENNPQGITFNTDGTKVFIVGSTGDSVYEYALTTAWDITTASYTTSLSVVSQEGNPYALQFNPDGTKLFICGPTTDTVYQYNLTTGFDISTASYADVSFSVSGELPTPTGLFIGNSGAKMYICGITNDAIYQYSTVGYTQTLDLSTGTFFSFTPSGATTVSFTNPPASGLATGFAVEVIGDGSAITWPSSVKWHLGTAPTATATKEIYTFITTDGGTTYYGKKAGENVA